MGIIFNFIVLFAAGFLILKSADLFIKGAVEISLSLRLSKVFIGATIVSIVTTTPELIVSSMSSAIGETGLAAGNAIGSCICNIGLVFAIGAIMKDVPITKEDLKYKVAFLLISLIVVYLLVMDGLLNKVEAVGLLLLFVIFIFINYRLALKGRIPPDNAINVPRSNHLLRKGIISFSLGGIFTVIIARYGLVYPGLAIAEFFKVPPAVIGLSMIALGTSLPELCTTVISSRKLHSEIALGNVVGASILDLLLVLGVSALINPLTIDRQTILFNMPVAVLFSVMMLILGFRNLRFSRLKGIIMLTIYVLYIAALFSIIYR